MIERAILAPGPHRLNVGCGRNIMEGWLNLDIAPLPGVDVVCDLETLKDRPVQLPDSCVERFLLSHVIEHVRDSLGLMQELWRLATPDASCVIRVPHGASDDAWEDPTHLRPYFPVSFGYFSQPFYWRADYHYRGDWQAEKISLFVTGTQCEGLTDAAIFERISRERNWVKEMVCELRAVKPMRPPDVNLQAVPSVDIIRM